ncbi:MAG: hypothetical protein NZ519_10560, partial [Bacteroidia bacterium]|nr:hypothetical protein [Bacteroidia bacterium]
AKHRSVSVARSTPTLPTQAQAKCGQGHAQKKFIKIYSNTIHLNFCKYQLNCNFALDSLIR